MKCDKCSKVYKHQQSLSRHKKVCSKSAIEHKQDEIETLKQMLKTIQEDIKKINNCVPSHEAITNITNNQNITINITNFGSENTKHLEDTFLTQCFLEKNIVDIIEKIHFDKEYPQYHNVRLKSLKHNMMETYDNGRWVVKDKGETYNRLVDKGATILKFHIRKNKEAIQDECEEEEEDFEDLKEYIDFVQNDNDLKAPILQKLNLLFVNDPEIKLAEDEFI
jgi:gas vesicle protein